MNAKEITFDELEKMLADYYNAARSETKGNSMQLTGTGTARQ